jgi:hypothetical protein
MRVSEHDWFSILIFVATMVASAVARYWRFFAQWLGGVRGRGWTTIPAVIDVVSVVPQMEEGRHGERVVAYLATLTYFYRNPELQMGEYSRRFDWEEEGRAWVDLFKGKTVSVHVDPNDSSKSVLRKDELEGHIAAYSNG